MTTGGDERRRLPGLEGPLWRALLVFRIAALGYAAVLMVNNFRHYAWPPGGFVIIVVMAVWTAVSSLAYARPERRGWPLLIADLAVAAACLLASRWIVHPAGLGVGAPTLPMAWVAGPVVAWAIAGGRRRGAIAAILLSVADVIVRNGVSQATLNGPVLMILAGIGVGHIARLAIDAEARLQRASELEAATRERERLARGIHDSVLQVLALVQRRGAELGGEAAELGRLAGAQESVLRSLIAAASPVPPADAATDLRPLLNAYASACVTIAAPATPVLLPASVANEVAAAVGAALDNVSRHAGPQARAWILLEELAERVTVSIRDDGDGIAEGRLVEAERDGRLGVAQSIRGRIRDLGGSVSVSSVAGNGTEVELTVPR
ncbi:MacS family sensor histidine kinase [Dactylosporangium sp. McL0621]|uniref:MacS family sensor histidine kinase n=1 Tax=Dactylosporangium sp. McL0621 TaxID=3415678 RepID=UPI003CFB7FD5